LTVDALLQHTIEGAGLPVKWNEYKGKKPEYIVLNDEDERRVDYADNRPQSKLFRWQVHIFTPDTSDYRKIKNEVQELLLSKDFTIKYTKILYEKETETMHVVISCSITEIMED